MISSADEILTSYFSGLSKGYEQCQKNAQKRNILERLTVARDTARSIQTGA
jgi:hypothetical protein